MHSVEETASNLSKTLRFSPDFGSNGIENSVKDTYLVLAIERELHSFFFFQSDSLVMMIVREIYTNPFEGGQGVSYKRVLDAVIWLFVQDAICELSEHGMVITVEEWTCLQARVYFRKEVLPTCFP